MRIPGSTIESLSAPVASEVGAPARCRLPGTLHVVCNSVSRPSNAFSLTGDPVRDGCD